MLTEMLSRPPSAVELADELHWSVKMVETLRRESRRDLVLNEAHMENQAVNTARAVPQEIQDVYYNIIPQHQLVLEHLFPLSGKPLLLKPGGGPDLPAIAKHTGLKTNQIRSALKSISNKVRVYRGERMIEEETGESDDHAPE